MAHDLKKGWARVTRQTADKTTLPEMDGAEGVYRVSGDLTFETPQHEPRDAALILLRENLERIYGPGEFRADIYDSLAGGAFTFVPATPKPVANLPKRAPTLL